MFQPEIIAKSRKNTSTFSTAGRAMTQFGGLPVSAGKGVIHGVTGVFRKGNNHEEYPPVPEIPSGQASQPVGQSDTLEAKGAAFPSLRTRPSMEGMTAGQEPGTLRVTVLDAKDLSSQDSKPYATIRVGDKEFKTKHVGRTATPEWYALIFQPNLKRGYQRENHRNESFVFAAGAYTPKLFAWVHDHKTLGKDKELGDGEVDVSKLVNAKHCYLQRGLQIWRHIQPEGISSADVFLELRQGGLLRLRLEFDATSNGSISSGERMSRTISIASPSRFSIRGKRPGADHDD